MLNLILVIFIFPFLPFFMYGNAFDFVQGGIDNNKVLGEEVQAQGGKDFCDDANSYTNNNLFPIDPMASAGIIPMRKPDYGEIKIWAGSTVAIDVDSGTILHYDNGRKRTQIASLTKIMTAVLAMENIKNLDEEITITKEALNIPGTVVGCPTMTFCNDERLHSGEKIKAGDLLKAMLLDSANDAATAIGIHIAGSEEQFVNMMNEKAKSLGLKDTNFCTPSGLETDGIESQCYSSAYDIARIASYSLKYELIWSIMKIEEDQIYSADGKYSHKLKNTDILLSEMPNCLGGKTGFTPMAGKSLLFAVSDTEKQHRIIAVILNDETRWTDMKTLINWIFDNYEWK